VSPGIKPLFFSQNIAQKLPEKKIPSTHANATNLYAKLASEPIHFRAHFAFNLTDSIVSIALNN